MYIICSHKDLTADVKVKINFQRHIQYFLLLYSFHIFYFLGCVSFVIIIVIRGDWL